jgi:putative transcriptional regulator
MKNLMENLAIALKGSRLWERSVLCCINSRVKNHPQIVKGEFSPLVNMRTGRVKLRIRELAQERNWTLQDVADHSGVNYNTVKSYARRDDGMNTVDLLAVYKIARAFGVTIEDLMEVVEE